MSERVASSRLPGGVVYYRADAEGWLRERKYLVDGRGIDDDSRGVFFSNASRENALIERGPRGGAAYEKLSRKVTLSDLQKAFRRARRIRSPLVHEWHMLWHARERGLRVPEPVAAGVTGGRLRPRSDFLITEALAGQCLSLHLGDHLRSMTVAERHRLATAVGNAVAALHAAGISFPDLYAKHVFVDRADDGTWKIGFLDLTSAYARRRLSRAERARDLGALAGSLPFRVPRPLLARFLRAYLSSGAWAFGDAWRRAAKAARNVQRLRRFRKSLGPATTSDPERASCVLPSVKAGPGWTDFGHFARFEGSERAARDEMSKVLLFEDFEVPGPRLESAAFGCGTGDVAVSTDRLGPSVTLRDELLEPFRRLLLATFRAGVLPMGDVLSHVRLRDDGALAWDVRAPLSAPRKARAIHARWRILFLRREIARSGLSQASRRSLIRWLGGEPVAAFALTRL